MTSTRDVAFLDYSVMSMRNPPHTGCVLHRLWLENCTPEAAAKRLGIDLAVLEPVLAGEAPVTPRIALALEDAGISNAAFWMRMQATYDLAQERLRQEREEGRRPPSLMPRKRPRLLPRRVAGNDVQARKQHIAPVSRALVIDQHAIADRPSGWHG